MNSTTIGRLLSLPIKSILPCQRCSPLLSQLLARNYLSVKRYGWLVKDARFSSQTLLLDANRLTMIASDFYLFSQDSESKENEKKRFRTPKDMDKGSSSSSGDSGKESDKDGEKDPDSQREAMIKSIATFALLLGITFVILQPMSSGAQPPDSNISWNEFYHNMLARGEVEQLVVQPHRNQVTVHLHPGANINGKSPWIRTYHLHVADTDSFERKLRKAEQELGISPDNGVPMVYERKRDNSFMIILLLVLAGLYILSLTQAKGSMTGGNMFSKLTRAKFTVVDSLTGAGKGVKFADVAGLKEAKVEIMEFVDYLKSSEKYSALGAKVPKGVLLLGPPGCGKTMLAKAVASEANVPFLAMAGTEFIEMIGGLGAARVRDLFGEARKRAPCIVYIDEIDSIGRKRSNTSTQTSGEEEQTLNQLLVEMDGMGGREGVILLASTNRAEVLDKALLRPGRFDRHILIDLPTLDERKEMFEKYLAQIKLSIEPAKYYSRLASLTPGFSGADIANVCNEAALNAARYKRKAVIPADLEYAVERVIGGMEKKSQVLSPHEKKVVAYHESGHALVGWLMKHTDALLKVTIVPRTNNVLGFAQYSRTDQKLYSKEELFDKMCMVLGGRAAESIIFNQISTGAQDDLTKVTKMAYAQIKQFGMDDEVGLLSFSDEGSFMSKPYSKRLGNLIDLQARRLVAQAYKVTEKVLLENKDKLKSMAEELLKHEVLNYKDVERLIGPPPHGNKKMIPELDLLGYEGQDASTANQDSPAKDTSNGDTKQP